MADITVVPLHTDFEISVVQAASFPSGVMAAHEEVKDHILNGEHTLYGYSHPDATGAIQYWAGASRDSISGEPPDTRTIRRGSFLAIEVKKFMDNLEKIGEAFQLLIHDPRADHAGYCLEEYNGEHVRCLVPMREKAADGDIREQLKRDIRSTFGTLMEIVRETPEDHLNRAPEAGSWSAGQTVEHIIKCGSEIPDKKTATAFRFPDQKVGIITDLFLNFNLKFEADSFLHPEQSHHHKSELLEKLNTMEQYHLQTASSHDLNALCLDMELPTFGLLTRYEWIRFVLVHTQRHIRQVRAAVALAATR